MRLFIMQPYISHCYPSFGLAHEFVNQGERVIFVGTSALREVIENEGFVFSEFKYLSEYLLKNSKAFIGLFLKSLVSKEYYLKRKDEFGNAFYCTKELIDKYKIDYVYIDQSLAEYYFFFKPYVPNITIVHTKVFSGKTKGIPPMTSLHIPKTNLLSKAKIEYLWFKELTKQRLREFLLKFVFLGKDEIYFWKKHCAKYGMDWTNQIDLKHCLNRGVRNVENIVFAPKELEFPTFKQPEHVRFFEEIYTKNESVYYTTAYTELKSKLLTKKKSHLIYMSFGTLAQGPKVINFFNTVISVIEELPETVLIISRGNHIMNLKKNKNVFIFDYLPQQDVLSFTDVFITHGGLGSVKEAFYYRVPMLVVPINKYIDQNGNAARVRANRFGDSMDIDNYSSTELEQKLKNLFYNF